MELGDYTNSMANAILLRPKRFRFINDALHILCECQTEVGALADAKQITCDKCRGHYWSPLEVLGRDKFGEPVFRDRMSEKLTPVLESVIRKVRMEMCKQVTGVVPRKSICVLTTCRYFTASAADVCAECTRKVKTSVGLVKIVQNELKKKCRGDCDPAIYVEMSADLCSSCARVEKRACEKKRESSQMSVKRGMVDESWDLNTSQKRLHRGIDSWNLVAGKPFATTNRW